MSAIVVTGLHLHPVKGCHRVEVDEVTVGRYGFVGDREWQIIRPDGAFISQRGHPQLVTIRPRLVDDGVELHAPGRAPLAVRRPATVDREALAFFARVEVADAGDDAAAWCSEVVGEPVRLVAMAEGYARTTARSIDVEGRPVSLADITPVTLASESSCRDLAQRASEPFPVERFRPNLVVDGAPPWAEDTWRTLRVGEATLDLPIAMPRCAVPCVDQETGQRTKEPARVLRALRWTDEPAGLPPELRATVGPQVYFAAGAVAGPAGARIRVGDRVEVLEVGEAVLPPPSGVPVPASASDA